MIRNYLSTALRVLRRDVGFASINISGLAVGLACCLLILVFILDETKYDQHHEKGDRIVRMALETRGGDGDWRGRVPTFYMLADLLGQNLSGVEATSRIAQDRALLIAESRQFADESLLLVEDSFFDVFTSDIVAGDATQPFSQPYSAVLTTDAAIKYFGTTDVVGRVISRNGEADFEVSAVIEPWPEHSHVEFDVLFNLESTQDRYSQEMFQSMGAQWLYTYVLLETAEPQSITDYRVNELIKGFIPDDSPVDIRMAVQPLTSIHLHSAFEGELGTNGDIRFLYILGLVGVFILVIGCVNFMNLATARAVRRSREVGVRKLLGAYRSQLVRQFLTESTGMALLAVFISLGLAVLALPVFNGVAGKALTAADVLSPGILLMLFVIALGVGLLAGTYPAFILSGYRPAIVLKGGRATGRKGGAYRFRQALVVLQFSISIAIVLGALVVYQQLSFMQNTYPGFDREQVLSVRLPSSLPDETTASLKEQFVQLPGIVAASAASHAPPQGLNSWRVRRAGASSDNNELVSRYEVDADYFQTLGIEILEGRGFRSDSDADRATGILINEAMASYYGLENPVGAAFEIESSRFEDGRATVIGVVRDFYQTSLHERIRPVIFTQSAFARQLLVKTDASQLSASLDGLSTVWSSLVPDRPFQYSFLDEQFSALYDAEQRLGRIFQIFSFLAVFVACMGLFGLSAYMAEKRIREVGVRKVFGASSGQLVRLLTRDFAILVGISYLIAAPITWFYMQQWLEDFAYRATFGPGLFIGTAVLAVSVAVLTVAWQAVRAARMNPVETLRYE